MKKTFTLLAMAALMSAPAYSLTVQDVLTLEEARGWDTSLDGGMGGASTDMAPNQFSFTTASGVALSNSTTATVSLYLEDTLLASQGTTGLGVDLWLGELSIDLYSEVQSKTPGLYRLVFSDDFLTSGGQSVEGGEYTFQFGEVVAPSKPQLKELLTLADARGWDTSLNDGMGDVSDAIAPNQFSFLAASGVALSKSVTAKVSFYLDDTLLLSEGTSSSLVDLWLGELTLDFYSVVQLNTAGTYRLVFSDGFLTYNGVDVEGGEYTFEYAGSGNGGDDDEIDFTYNLNPMPTISVDKLGVIELAFPKYLDTDLVAYSMLTDEPVATITNEDGTFYRSVLYPSASNGVITFEFGNAETVWPAGKYTFTVNPDKVAVGIANFKVDQPGNFAGLTVTYDVTGFAPAPKPELKDYLVTVFPTAECTNVTTADYGNGADGGMMTYIFTATADIQPAPANTWPDWIQLTFTDEQTGEIEYLPAINPNNSDELNIQLVSEVVPLSEENPTYTWTLHFNTDADWGYSAAMYQKAGTYTLSLPNNTFMLDGEPMNGVDFVYTYTVVPTGVAAIDAAESYVVYTIDGRLVYNGAEKSDINSLDAGLYIINGKKVMIVK